MPPRTVTSRRCNVCVVEKTLSKNDLHLCSGCRLIRYCGREHQRLDWKIHKPFCSAVKHILQGRQIAHIMELEGPVTTWAQFEKALILAKCLLHTLLKRELYNHEVELLTFPVHCQVCFSFSDSKTFSHCLSCEAVSYCNPEHQKQDIENHSKWCLYLKYYYDFYETDNVNIELNFEDAPIVDEKSMPEDLFSLMETVSIPFKDMQISKEPKSLSEYQSYVAVSDFSCVATLLHAIRLSCLRENDVDTLIIYLIGARDEFVFLLDSHCAFLASQLPSIKEFKFYLIGPQIQRLSKSLSYSVCPHETEVQITINFIKDYFENFVDNLKSNAALDRMPHLIAAFNCGFYEYAGTVKDTWRQGIKALFEFEKIPIVFTSYTRLESRFDLREFSECGNELNKQYHIIANGEMNPYKDYRPFRNMELHDRNDLVYFRNGYMNIVVVKSKRIN